MDKNQSRTQIRTHVFAVNGYLMCIKYAVAVARISLRQRNIMELSLG